MLSSLYIFTLLVVEKNGKKRLVVCGRGFAFPHVSPLRVGSREPIFLADTMYKLVRCLRCSPNSMIGGLPQFPGVVAPHLASGVQPCVFKVVCHLPTGMLKC